jgi:acyl carrier protein
MILTKPQISTLVKYEIQKVAPGVPTKKMSDKTKLASRGLNDVDLCQVIANLEKSLRIEISIEIRPTTYQNVTFGELVNATFESNNTHVVGKVTPKKSPRSVKATVLNVARLEFGMKSARLANSFLSCNLDSFDALEFYHILEKKYSLPADYISGQIDEKYALKSGSPLRQYDNITFRQVADVISDRVRS